ncbi:MAG: PIN domain-containing protein [Rhodobacteraceae bacterium]|nr:PIN domain-containing protein [Paracoccaceae bacterium]
MRAFLDACVLYPTVLREVLLAAAGEGLFEPLWSPRVLEEWARAAARLGPVAEARARGEIALLKARLPDALVADDPGSGLLLPDLADAHVAAAARAAGADLVVTLNLRDFPPRAMAALGLRAEHPDAFLDALRRADPAAVARAAERVRAEAERLSGEPQPLRPLLKRAKLPRLAKALTS